MLVLYTHYTRKKLKHFLEYAAPYQSLLSQFCQIQSNGSCEFIKKILNRCQFNSQKALDSILSGASPQISLGKFKVLNKAPKLGPFQGAEEMGY